MRFKFYCDFHGEIKPYEVVQSSIGTVCLLCGGSVDFEVAEDEIVERDAW